MELLTFPPELNYIAEVFSMLPKIQFYLYIYLNATVLVKKTKKTQKTTKQKKNQPSSAN